MRRVAVAAAVTVAAVLACEAHPRYPACESDAQCAVGGRHDYCVAGRCAYCRTAIDCGDRQMCRAGRCLADPNAPPPPAPDAGADAAGDAAPDARADAGADEPPPEIIRSRE